MAVDMFLKLDSIDGEANDEKHTNEIDVLAWSWGMSNSGTFHLGSGGGAGKVNVQDLSVTKYIDKSSATLMTKCASGEHIKDGVLTVRKAGGKAALEYYVVKLEKIMVSSVSTGGSGGEDRLTENLSLNFEEVKVEYQEQDDKTGASKGGPVKFGWNMAKNVAA